MAKNEEDNTKTQVITAIAFLTNNAGKLLVAKRADESKFMPGIWELPGGHIEFGESIEDGLKREIMEEFDFDISVGSPFASFSYINKNSSKQTFEIALYAKLLEEKKATLNPREHSDYRWIDQNDCDKYLAGNKEEHKIAKEGFASKNK